MKEIKLKWKIYFYLLVFCAFLLILLWLSQIAFLDQFYRYVKIREIKSSAASIERNFTSDNLKELIDRMSGNNDIYIEIINENGRAIYASDTRQDSVMYKMTPAEKRGILLTAMEQSGELMTYYNREGMKNNRPGGFGVLNRNQNRMNTQQRYIIYTKIMQDRQGRVLAIFINTVIVPVESTVKTLRILLYFITGFMILFSIILAFFIARKVSRPIEKINESAKILAKGKYNTKFQGSNYREINELADTLNYTTNELAKVDNLRKELIANISHDLRTPLTMINGYAEAMCDLPGELNAENAKIIMHETKRLNTLVNDVLDLSKLQSGMKQIKYAEYNLTESLKSSVEYMNELLRKDGYHIDFHRKEEVLVNSEESQISQAFYNLLINGVNYTGSDKAVIVRQVLEGDWVKIEVIDSGAGIDQEHLLYIWERYYKVDKNHKRPTMGTGLGLSIVKSVLEQHGGKYGVTSKLGVGSVFWFALQYKRIL